MTRGEILSNYDRHRVEPVTLSKNVAEYEQMYKWMVECLTKFQGRGIYIDRVNWIRVAKSIIFLNILRAMRHHEFRFFCDVLASTFVSLYTYCTLTVTTSVENV